MYMYFYYNYFIFVKIPVVDPQNNDHWRNQVAPAYDSVNS